MLWSASGAMVRPESGVCEAADQFGFAAAGCRPDDAGMDTQASGQASMRSSGPAFGKCMFWLSVWRQALAPGQP